MINAAIKQAMDISRTSGMQLSEVLDIIERAEEAGYSLEEITDEFRRRETEKKTESK